MWLLIRSLALQVLTPKRLNSCSTWDRPISSSEENRAGCTVDRSFSKILWQVFPPKTLAKYSIKRERSTELRKQLQHLQRSLMLYYEQLISPIYISNTYTKSNFQIVATTREGHQSTRHIDDVSLNCTSQYLIYVHVYVALYFWFWITHYMKSFRIILALYKCKL